MLKLIWQRCVVFFSFHVLELTLWSSCHCVFAAAQVSISSGHTAREACAQPAASAVHQLQVCTNSCGDKNTLNLHPHHNLPQLMWRILCLTALLGINKSLSSSCWSSNCYHSATLEKKLSLDPNSIESYRLICKLQFLSRVQEKVVAEQPIAFI